jgi:RHS repeat-associated protein
MSGARRVAPCFRERRGCLPHPRGAREASEHGFGGGARRSRAGGGINNFFRPATLQVSNASPVTFSYDADSLYDGTSSPAFAVTRDVSGSSLDGLPYASTLGSVSDAWTYDGFGAQASYTVKTSDGTVLYAMYGSGALGSPIARDANGRITSMTELVNGVTHAWAITYDARVRLESATRDGVTTAYAYDPNGNLTEINGATFGSYDAQDRLVSFVEPGGGSWNLTYSNNGDLEQKLGDAQTYEFEYDLSSNLRSVQITGTGAGNVGYIVDGLNRRVEKEATASSGAVNEGLLYDEQGRVVAELDGSNNVLSTFVYGLKPNVPDYMVRGGVAYRIVSDWRGDVRLVLDTTKTGAAAIVEQIDYDEWGNVLSLVDPACSLAGTALCWQPFGFAGGLWEPSTGIVRFGARDYDPAQRRWTQKDPITFKGHSWNIYEYAGDDPINGSDPSGKDECTAACTSAGISGAQNCEASFPVLIEWEALVACEDAVAIGNILCLATCEVIDICTQVPVNWGQYFGPN